MKIFSKILVPIDFSPGSETALNYAIEISELFSSTLYLLYVIEPLVLPSTPGFPAINPVDLSLNMKHHYESELKKIASKISGNINKNIDILTGKAADIINKYAEENNIDLICIATHGRKGLEHLIFGSTTEKVLRKAKCPVLALRISN